MQVLEDRSTEERSYLFNIIKQDGIDHSYIMSDLVCTYIYTCFRRFLVCYFPIYIIMYIIQEAITSQPIQYIGACARKPSQERTSQNNAPSRSHEHVYLYTHICTYIVNAILCIHTHIHKWIQILFIPSEGSKLYSFQILFTDARGCSVKFVCSKISAIRLRMHTCINGHIYNSGAWTPNEGFMQSLLRTRFAIINLQSVLCTLQHCHSNKLSHRLSLRMKFGTGTLDPMNHDTHTHTHTP